MGAVWATSFKADAQAPSKIAAKPLSPTSVKLSWRGSENSEKYVVRLGSNRSLTRDSEQYTIKATTTTLNDLRVSNPGVDRYFRVDAYNGDKVASSRTGSFSMLPAEIGKLKVAKVSDKAAKLSWKESANARQYDVVRATDKNFTKEVVAVRTRDDKAIFTTDGLDPSTKYYFRVRPVNGQSVGPFSKEVSDETLQPATTFSAATFNVCSETCSRYGSRGRMAAALLNAAKVDIFGLQEAGGIRVGRTTNAMFSGGSQGFARAAGGAKARYIFYRPAVFDQLNGGLIALGNGRYAAWAHMKIKATGTEFYFLSLHLENGHGNDSKRASEMRTLVTRMSGINSDGLPVIYAGDFNSHPKRSADSPTAIFRSIGVTDSLLKSKSEPVNARINSGHTFSTTVLASGAHVDHIFVTKDVKVEGWEQLVRLSGGRYAKPILSDHNALKAKLTLSADIPDLGSPTETTSLADFQPGATMAR